MLAIGMFLNSIAPLRYKNQIQNFFENPKWKLNAAVPAFVENTFHRLFGGKILSWRFFLTSVIFSLVGFAIFTSIYFTLNTDPICKYPVDWCEGFRVDLVRETSLLIAAMVVVDILSFSQTFLMIRYALRSERSYELIFIAYADIVLSLSIFCFVLPSFLTLNQVMIPEKDTKTDIFLQFIPYSQSIFELSKELQTPLDPATIDEPDADRDNLDDFLQSLGNRKDENARLKELAKSARAQLIELKLYIRDSEKKDRLSPAAEGPAVAKGSIEEVEVLVRSIGAQNGISISEEQHRSTYARETFSVLKANVSLIQVPLVITYSSLYAAVLGINQAFMNFLRGNPLFVDMNREPLLAMVAGVRSAANKQYICICSNGWSSAGDPDEFLNQERYLIFDSSLFTSLATSHVAFERPRHLVSLSVFFATSMFVTIVFYFGLLVFLLPAYAYRTTLVSVLEMAGAQGKKNAISIAVALGALPLAILLVIASRVL
jgi:hypothetical protein